MAVIMKHWFLSDDEHNHQKKDEFTLWYVKSLGERNIED